MRETQEIAPACVNPRISGLAARQSGGCGKARGRNFAHIPV